MTFKVLPKTTLLIIGLVIVTTATVLYYGSRVDPEEPSKTKERKLGSTAESSAMNSTFKTDIDYDRRTVTVFDCEVLNDLQAIIKGLAIFDAHAERLFKSSNLKTHNQKSSIMLDRINGNCKIKIGRIYNS